MVMFETCFSLSIACLYCEGAPLIHTHDIFEYILLWYENCYISIDISLKSVCYDKPPQV